MNGTPPTKQQCARFVPFFASSAFLLTTVVFLITILICHGLASANISLYFHINHTASKEVIIFAEYPAVICLLASAMYFGLGLASLRGIWYVKAQQMANMVDAIIFPFLLTALAPMTDGLQILLMMSCYVTSYLSVHALQVHEFVSVQTIYIAWITFSAFWMGYFIEFYVNWVNSSPETGIIQLNVLVIMVYDAYRIVHRGGHEDFDYLFKTYLRLILILMVFAQELVWSW